ncbi:MAG: TetR/AcrR family transcriptional regulator, partial [Hominilimicola sp.]
GRYKAICMAMSKFQREYPYSVDNVNSVNPANLDFSDVSDAVRSILLLGKEINTILASFIETGKENGIVRKDIVPMLTVYVLWSSITALLTLADTKGQFICSQFFISENDFLDYGFKQIINSILEVRI